MSLTSLGCPGAVTYSIDRVRLLAGRRALVTTPLLISGCSEAPTQNIVGSFFPAWLLCSLLGIILAIVLRQALVLAGIHEYVLFPLAVYAACAAIGTMSTWLVWFGH